MTKNIFILCCYLITGSLLNAQQSVEFDAEANLKYCATQATKTLQQIPDYQHEPGSIDSGKSSWRWTQPGSWTCGFWPGILWYLYEYDGDKKWLAAADSFTRAIIPPATGHAHSHDVGFMAYCSIGNGYRLTGNPVYKQALLQAADSLAVLYNPAVGTILSWPNMVSKMNWPHNTIIDNMMNLELLFWASKNGGGQSLYDIAFKHAETTMLHHFRPDFSTWHVAVYDDYTGKFIKGATHQGYADETMWARGQAWAIYGFTIAYRETHDKRFLETANKAADIFLRRLPAGGIPYWDFDAPNIPREPQDASAAAITASALIELASFSNDKEKSGKYIDAARKILLTLSSEAYQSRNKNTAFLLHSTGHKPNNSEVDASIIYADYYYLEALLRWKAIEKNVVVASPDGAYRMHIFDDDGKIYYTINYKGNDIILKSSLGISGNQTGKAIESDASGDNKATSDWYDNMRIDTVTMKQVDSSWRPVYGERSLYADHYNEATIELSKLNNPRKRLQIIVRAYNEGVGFRYRFTGNEYLHITQEFTQYAMPEGTKAWFTRRAQAVYQLLPLKNWPEESERPLVCEIPCRDVARNVSTTTYVLLTEAAMTDYARTKFILDEKKPNTITGLMYGAVDEIAPCQTPWRVVMAAENAGRLLENNFLLLNLNPPCEIDSPSWIRPGKVMREVTLTTEGGKALVDFAVKRNLQYIHFDAGWYGPEGSKLSDATKVSLDPARNRQIDALNLEEVIAYAKSKNIGVILYVNQRALAQQLDTILPLYQKWGVSGIKFGFVQVGSHYWTKWLHEAVKKCARYHLMVDIHDEYRPTGFSRTYPNLMTQEGVYGNEEFPDATNNVTLPFTRFTQGAADYTICYYRQQWDKSTKPDTGHGLVNAKLLKTTSAHQLAMAAVYYSPLQYMYWYDKPSDSRDEPELEFFDRIPTVWDDTKVIHGEIGKYITVARRSGNEWFVGTMTNNEGRRLNLPLDFLEKGKSYTATIYYDDPSVATRTKVGIKKMKVNNGKILDINLLPSGGQAILIEAE